ncbi:proline-specific peptidase [Myriangium duriaei CBS 260.36]|uniref:Proline-specific peptidase n=1 Tax=Myriangium duriaei CBS 260.36 TaxID=1168546 RepID=A0A9P4IWJ8_9PEZI|nr:proline-specific peptidase [Myriangium duriaei CBS 260.36]
MTQVKSEEGKIALAIPSVRKACHTYYNVIGDLACGKPAVVCLHGGPGSTHAAMLPFAAIWKRFGHPVIFYDTIGCGQSTNLDDEKAGDESFWQMSLFVNELEVVLDHFNLPHGYYLLGQSFGGTLGVEFATTQRAGLLGLILGNATSSMDLAIEAVWIRVGELPFDAQEALRKGAETRNTATDAFKDAYRIYVKHCICRMDPLPPWIDKFIDYATSLTNPDTVKGCLPTMMGWCPVMTKESMGSLRGWNVIPRLHQVNVKTLIWNGEFAQTHDICIRPMFDRIPRVHWVTLPGSAHLSFFEGDETLEKCLGLVGDFLNGGSV